MSVINSSELHIRDNAAFDCGDSLDAAFSWSIHSIDKENHNTTALISPLPFTTSNPKPLQPINFLCDPNTTAKDLNGFKRSELGFAGYEEQIDMEIGVLKKEITKLSCRLQELRREKAERDAETGERRGGAAFMEVEQDKKNSIRDLERMKILEDSIMSSYSAGVMSRQRRGSNLGPAEIRSAGAKTQQMISKMEAALLTPVNQKQERKSCFWKLDQIDELKMAKERGFKGGKSSSLCPVSKKPISKVPKQATTTIGSKKIVEKDDRVVSSVQPRKLFNKEVGEKTSHIKPVRAGRVVASRYNNNKSSNQAMNENVGLRKRCLPENDDLKGNEKKRASLGQKSCSKNGRVKKKWDIPTEVVMYNG